ncbi:MAG: TRAP transporter large permease subunit, partial [Pseudomonadota bacterium]
MISTIPFTPWLVLLVVTIGSFLVLAVRKAPGLAAFTLVVCLGALIFGFPYEIATGWDTQPVRDFIWDQYAVLPQVSGMGVAEVSIWLFVGIVVLLAIGMPLGFASGFLAVMVLYLRFGPDVLFRNFGTGPFNIIAQRIYGLMTDYVIISVPLFIFMASLLERSGLAKDMYSSLNVWLSRTRGG